MRTAFRAVANSETQLAVVKNAERNEFAQAYLDPRSAAESMGDYCYSVGTVMSPFVGCAPEPGQHHNAFINSMQFRSDKEISIPKPAGTYRIFIVGGSTAFGSGAPSQDKTIGAYLNAILEKELSPATRKTYEVFTMATPAWASTQERIIIENKLLDLQPDLVISFSGNNDVHWGMCGDNVMWFRTYQEEFDWHVLDWASEKFRSKPMIDVVPIDAHPIAPSLVADRLERNVKMSAFALGTKNIRYAFCLQPTLALTRKPLDDAERRNLGNLNPSDQSITGSNYFSECYAKIDARLAALKLNNFAYVNLSDSFDAINTPDRIFLDCYHFGDKGNALVARALFNRLRNYFTP